MAELTGSSSPPAPRDAPGFRSAGSRAAGEHFYCSDLGSLKIALMKTPKVCIYGAGAIGGMVGTLLARSGATVSVIAHGRTLAAVEHSGLQLITRTDTLQATVQVTGNPADLGPQDYVVIAVKAPALPQVAARIEPLVGPETAIVIAMNGLPWWFFADQEERLAKPSTVDPDGTIARAIPASRVVGCAIYMACSIERPGVIRHHAGRRLLVGAVQDRSSDQAKRLVNHLRNAGLDCDVSSDIRRDVWLKLWANLSTNPISLLTTSTLDRIIDDPLVHRLCVRMMEEAAQIGKAIGIDPAASIEEIIDKARLLGAFKTSMLQDAERGRPIEIDALLTVVHDIGRAVGIKTPFIDSVLGLARLRARSLGLFEDAALNGGLRRYHNN